MSKKKTLIVWIHFGSKSVLNPTVGMDDVIVMLFHFQTGGEHDSSLGHVLFSAMHDA